MRKNKLLALGLAALMAASVAGCSTPSASVDDTKAAESGSDSSQSAAAGEKIFRYSNLADIATIDPDKTNSVADATVPIISMMVCTATYRASFSRQPLRAMKSAMMVSYIPSNSVRIRSGVMDRLLRPRIMSMA